MAEAVSHQMANADISGAYKKKKLTDANKEAYNEDYKKWNTDDNI
jgi:hypothetical protein